MSNKFDFGGMPVRGGFLACRPSGQQLCFSSGGYECRPSVYGARAKTKRSHAATFSRFIENAPGNWPTVSEAVQRVIGPANLLGRSFSNPNIDRRHPGDREVNHDDVRHVPPIRHFVPPLFDASRTCALGICSEGDVAA